MAGLSSWGIFLSYRREDAAPYARLLQFQLRERVPDARVFMDRFEVQAALERGVRVIPVLIDGARRFSRSNCPPSCKSSPGSMLLS